MSLKPGSAISVTLVDGDYEVKSIGTLTWIEDNRILAFGHPFFNRGSVDYGFGGAEILDTVTSRVFPFKIGVGYSPVGRITEDRGAGIAGVLDSAPEFIEVSVLVRGERETEEDHYSFRDSGEQLFRVDLSGNHGRGGPEVGPIGAAAPRLILRSKERTSPTSNERIFTMDRI